MGPPITEIARSLSTEKFYSSVAKMQKKRMTTPNVWASFTPQNRQGAKILANFAVKSWEDQIFGARRRCHRTTDKDHAIPVKQGFQPCFFLLFAREHPSTTSFPAPVHASKPHTGIRWRGFVSRNMRHGVHMCFRPARMRAQDGSFPAISDEGRAEDFFFSLRQQWNALLPSC